MATLVESRVVKLNFEAICTTLAHGRNSIHIEEAFLHLPDGVVGYSTITERDCEDHFDPKRGFVQVLQLGRIVELIGQVGSCLLLNEEVFRGQVAVFSQVSVSTRDFAFPGEKLGIYVQIDHRDGRKGSAHATGGTEGISLFEATANFAIVTREFLQRRYNVRRRRT